MGNILELKEEKGITEIKINGTKIRSIDKYDIEKCIENDTKVTYLTIKILIDDKKSTISINS